MRLNIKYIATAVVTLITLTTSCENPYENVTGDAVYSGDPFVMLSSEEASIYIEQSDKNNSDEPGLFIDSLVLSHPLEQDLVVKLTTYSKNTFGEVGTNFRYQSEVTIDAGARAGYFEVEAIDIDATTASSMQLAIVIESCDNPNVIAGLNGIKLENEDRQKRNKVYTFR